MALIHEGLELLLVVSRVPDVSLTPTVSGKTIKQ